MSKFLKALAKMKLVELDEQELETPSSHDGDQDIDKILAETRAMMGETETPAVEEEAAPDPEPVAPPPQVSVPAEIQEGRAFEDIYAEAGVPESPYPAEQMLKLLDGLKAMGPRERKMAVMAMDAADDRWTIADPVLDAQRKIDSLRSESARLDAFAEKAEAEAQAGLQAQEDYKSEATQTIRKQISELEALLEEELRKVAEEKASIHLKLESTRGAVTREKARFEAEMDSLFTLSQTFGTDNETEAN
ncbi:MAG: methyl-accepting chemotaxis protein [Myxococcota bacterium]|nr:methyl-accepting chemotaxis protein [Myxococcota bacterium]